MTPAATDVAWYEMLAQRFCVAAGASAAGTDASLTVRWWIEHGEIQPRPDAARLSELLPPVDRDVVARLAAQTARDGEGSATGPSGTRYDAMAHPSSAAAMCWIWRPPTSRADGLVRAIEQRLVRFVGELRDLGVMAGTAPQLDALPGADTLSARERAIVVAMLAGARTATISRDLGVSDSTVRSHLSAAFGKLGVKSQVELIERFRPR